ncbi:MAG: hypothetical protein AAF567_08475 [Actinomycetota bacterium]
MSRHELFGWLMFSLSGVFFLIIGFRDGEPLVIAGAVVWMIGCASFLAAPRR